ncbi:MAG: substrate-binding domain-containing protein [Arthrobacter sp.]
MAVLSALLSLAACSTTPAGVVQGALTGIGSGPGQGAVSAWGLSWSQQVKGTSASYSPDGSAAGLQAFRNGQAHFAISSAPLAEDEAAAVRGMCTPAGSVSVAAGVLPVGVAVKIKGVNDLILDAGTLAGILQGEITRWNDPKLVALNEGTALPDLAITVITEEEASDTTRPINEYLGKDSGTGWNPPTPDRWPSRVEGQTSSRPLDIADKLDDTNGGLAILDGSVIGNRFVAVQLVFDGKPRRLQASSVVDAIATGDVTATPHAVTQTLDGRSGYALGTVIYVHMCKEYSEPALSRLSRSFGENVLGEVAQKNANTHAFVMSPSKKAVSEGLAVISTIGDGQ